MCQAVYSSLYLTQPDNYLKGLKSVDWTVASVTVASWQKGLSVFLSRYTFPSSYPKLALHPLVFVYVCFNAGSIPWTGWQTDFTTRWASTGRTVVHGTSNVEGVLDCWKPQLPQNSPYHESTDKVSHRPRRAADDRPHGRIASQQRCARGWYSVFLNPAGLKLIWTTNKAWLEFTMQDCPSDIIQLCVYFVANKIYLWLLWGSFISAHYTSVKCLFDLYVLKEVHWTGFWINANQRWIAENIWSYRHKQDPSQATCPSFCHKH